MVASGACLPFAMPLDRASAAIDTAERFVDRVTELLA